MLTFTIIISIVIAFIFNFLNGMNDAANSISTIIATKVLTPMQAIIWAAFWEFVAFFLCKFVWGFAVANTMGAGIADQNFMNSNVVLSALIAAAIWVAICNKSGMPISTSHALIGGIIGAVWFVNGAQALIGRGILLTLSFIIFSPLIGLLIAFFMQCFFMRILRNCKKKKIEKIFKKLQLVSTAAFCIGHGSNDAQKTMGVIAILMFSALGNLDISSELRDVIAIFYDYDKGFYIPDGLAVVSYLIMSFGVIIGGRRVIGTLGYGIAKINPVRGFSAEFAGATALIGTSILGIPVSTTHTITGSIIGVGLTDGVKSVKWLTANRILIAWLLTIPVPLIIGGLINLLLNLFV